MSSNGILAAERIESLLHEPYVLTEEQKAFFRNNGFIRLKNVFPAALLDHFTPVSYSEFSEGTVF
jgi:N-acetylglutamate synthase-like GNAT family acetyltransferase